MCLVGHGALLKRTLWQTLRKIITLQKTNEKREYYLRLLLAVASL